METIILAALNFANLALLAFLATRLRGMRRLVVALLKDLQRDLATQDIDKPLSDFPYRAEFVLALDILIHILGKAGYTSGNGKEP